MQPLNVVDATTTCQLEIGYACATQQLCETHCRAGEVFKRLNAKKAKLKKEDAELGRDPKRMQKQLKRELNALQTGVEISTGSRNATVTMRPKYNSVLSVGVNPNFLSESLKRRFGR